VGGKTGWKKTDNAFGALDIPFGSGRCPEPRWGRCPQTPTKGGSPSGALPLDPALILAISS
ncbi:hypothetical protein Tco_0326072, partial [Tanacetum coccineum]